MVTEIKNYLVFEDTKCIAAINATSYEDNMDELLFFRDNKWFLSVPYNQQDEVGHIYTIVEGNNAVGSYKRACISR